MSPDQMFNAWSNAAATALADFTPPSPTDHKANTIAACDHVLAKPPGDGPLERAKELSTEMKRMLGA